MPIDDIERDARHRISAHACQVVREAGDARLAGRHGVDTEVSLESPSGKYRVTTLDREDVYNGMILTVAKNLPKGATETVQLVAFMPKPRIIQLQITPAGEHRALVGVLTKTAVHYVFKPKLGTGLGLFAKLVGRMPPDCHVWIVTDDVPAFVRFDGPLLTPGPVWRIELTSPRWPDEPK